MKFSRRVWEDLKKGKSGIWIGAVGGALAYFVWNWVSPGTFIFFSTAPPSVVEQVINTTIAYKGLIMTSGIGSFVGWFIDINNWGDRYIKRFAKSLKSSGVV